MKGKVEYQSNPISINEIKLAIKTLSIKKSFRPHDFMGEFQHQENKSNPHHLFQNIEKEETPPNSLYETSIILTLRNLTNITRKRQSNIFSWKKTFLKILKMQKIFKILASQTKQYKKGNTSEYNVGLTFKSV